MLGLLHDAAEPARARTRTAPSPAHAAIRFRGVSFTYPARDGAVLDGLELTIAPRETLAVVGESGAGKSTLASLLLGLAQPTSGSLELDGIDLADCRLEEWRSLVAWVPQQPTIFRGTVTENIRLARPDATDAEVRSAAVRSGADAFVCRLPDGYDTLVGDGGRALSAGERRRIALARALVREAALIVLDEPTADLDPESAELVAHAIDELHGQATILLIAHRPALAALADRTVWLTDGKAIERRDPVAA
jgi:ABC-type multidrug transport system fused ATPase/permease subunit